MRIIDLHRRRIFNAPASNFVKESSGLLLNEDFADVSEWTLEAGWANALEPSLVSFDRSPYIALHPSSQAPNQPPYTYASGIPSDVDNGGVREGAMLKDDDGTWYLYYGAGDGTVAWRPQVARSRDKGITWEKMGDMGLDLNKYTSPGTTPDGTWPALDMLYIDKADGVYYLHRMRAGTVSNTVPGQPYSSEVFGSNSPLGPWSWIGETVTPGKEPVYDSVDSLMGSVIFYNGEYHTFSSDTNDNGDYFIGRHTAPTLDSTPVRVPGTVLPAAIKGQPENPKVFFHTELNRWVMTVNQVNKTAGKTDKNSVYISTDPLDWSNATRLDFQHICAADGANAIGIPSPISVGGSFLSYQGYVPFSYDTDPTVTPWHNNRKLRWAVLEPSPAKLTFTASTGIKEAVRTFAHDDFTAEFIMIPQATGVSGIAFRTQSNGDCYQLKVQLAGNLVLEKVTNGIATVVFSNTGLQKAAGGHSSNKIRISAAGKEIRAWLNGELQIEYITDSTPYLSGDSIKFFSDVNVDVRQFHLRKVSDLTVKGLQSGDKVVLRTPGGLPLIQKTVQYNDRVIFGAFEGIIHFPAGEIEVNGTTVYSGLIWGGDVIIKSGYNDPGITPNTFIGGVASTIPTRASLASKLSLSENDITYFKIEGSDVHARIEINYVLADNAFNGNQDITFYKDAVDGKVTHIGHSAFNNCDSLKTIEFSNVTTSGDAVCQSANNVETFYIPKLNPIGTTSGDNLWFQYPGVKRKIYAHPDTAINNAGAPDGDLQYAMNQGSTVVAEVKYVANFTKPNAVTDLSVGQKYAGALQLNFTLPRSANALDFYEVYLDGIYHSKIAAPGDYVEGLSYGTSYDISIIAVDEFYNRSEISATIQATTNAQPVVSLNGLVSYHKLEETTVGVVVDSHGTNDATNNGLTVNVTGKVGKGYQYTAGSNSIVIPYSSDYDFTNATNDIPFSISMWRSFETTGNVFVIGKTNGSARVWEVIKESGYLIFRLSSEGSVSNRIERRASFTPTSGKLYNIIVTYDGSGTVAGMKVFIDNVEVGTTAISGTYSKMISNTNEVWIGKFPTLTSYTVNGVQDEIEIHKNHVLTKQERAEIWNNENGITL